jgi:hypothetical protein
MKAISLSNLSLRLLYVLLSGLFVILILYGCASSSGLPISTPISKVITPVYTSILSTTPTPGIVFTLTPVPLTPTYATAIVPSTVQPDNQLYLDPAGWYSLEFPADWQLTEKNAFAGTNGFFESGYLPNMGYMRNALQVCQWLANVDTKGIYSVAWVDMQTSCMLNPINPQSDAAILEVIENPDAPLSQRFLFIKSDARHYPSISSSIQWLQPSEQQIQSITTEMDPEVNSFWKKALASPLGLKIKEYELSTEAQMDDADKSYFYDYVPPEAIPTLKPDGTNRQPSTWETLNEAIAPYGYEFRVSKSPNFYQLTLNGDLRAENIYQLPTLHRFTTPDGELMVFVVSTLKDPNLSPYDVGNGVRYLAQNDRFLAWETNPLNPMETGDSVIYANGELLWTRVNEQTLVSVQTTEHEVLYTFATYYITRIPINGFKSWKDHWILEISDFVIMDGEILNELYDFEEVFQWGILNNQPFSGHLL